MTDFFKLLTRSASIPKLPSGGSQGGSSTVTLLSHPVHSAEATTEVSSKKRKREAAGNNSSNGGLSILSRETGAGSDVIEPIDKKRKKKKKKKGDSAHREPDVQVFKDAVVNIQPLDAKSLLKLHKLKYTILAGTRSPEKDDEGENEDTIKEGSLKKSKEQKKKEKEALKKEKRKKRKEAEEKEIHKSSKLGQIYPTPLQAFEELRTNYRISSRLFDNIMAQRYITPTEVQMGSLPLLLDLPEGQSSVPELEGSHVDLMTIAATGSGKTLAYAIPTINSLMQEKHDAGEGYEKGIRVVLLSPTRELADQIVNEFRKLMLGTGLRVVGMKRSLMPKARRRRMFKASAASDTVFDEQYDSKDESDSDSQSEYDDADEGDSESEDGNISSKGDTQKGMTVKAEVLVSTPLILLHALEQCPDLFPVSHVSRIIFDEADVLLDDLFLSQIKAIASHLKSPSLHFTFWSATMPSSSEKRAQELIADHQSAVNSTTPRKLVRLIAGIKDSSLPTIQQTITYTASERGKLLALRQRFSTSLKTPCLIFVQTIPRAQALQAEIMYDLSAPERIACLHSNLSDTRRSAIMDEFRKGEVWVLITTDLLSRGVDFKGVKLVINYDMPTSVANYIHRVGRTGRAGREGGEAVTYYTEDDVKYVRGIVQVMENSGGEGLKGVDKWMLKSLPKTTKNEKKELKKRGVKERRVGAGAGGGDQSKGERRSRISTKSGYDRKNEVRKKAAIEASKMRKSSSHLNGVDGDSGSEPEWEGFD